MIAKMRAGDAEYEAYKGEKLMAYETKFMTDCTKKLSNKVDLEADIDDQLLVVIDKALEQSETLATYANMRLDELSKIESEEKALIQARPKLTYKIFCGDAGTWGTFQRNKKEIYKMF